MTMEYAIVDRYSNRQREIMTHERDLPSWEARLACTLVEKWGMIAAVDAGEDSAGRAKGRLMDPAEVVARACNIAEMTAAECRRRGWVDQLPPIAELLGEEGK